MIKLSEVKLNIATAIAAAFGFIIALIWKDIIIGAMKLAELWQDGGFADAKALAIGVVVGVIITVVAVIGIILFSKWGGIEKK